MRKFIVIALVAIAAYGCGDGGHPVEITVKNQLKDIEFTHYRDSFEVMHGQYKIFAMLKNKGKQHYKYLAINASYLDENGKQMAQSIGGPGILAPGDSAIVETGWLFPQKKDLPYKVVLSLTR